MTIKEIDDQAVNSPLSKEELRKQFVEKTAELGINIRLLLTKLGRLLKR